MENFNYYSYLTSTTAYTLLFFFATFRKKRDWIFILAALFSIIWSFSATRTTLDSDSFLTDTLVFETLRNVSWFLMIATLTSSQLYGNNYQYIIRSKFLLPIIAFILLVLLIESVPDFLNIIQLKLKTDPRLFAHVVLAVIGLILIEQLYRNTPLIHRWNIKFLCLSLGAIFSVNLLVYSKSLLYMNLDLSLWQSRGIINALMVPFMTLSLPRLDSLNLNNLQSSPRKATFHTTILIGSGVYLMLMSATGYYLKQANAEWGETIQSIFIFLALLILIISLSSGKIRALAKVYFGKHFFHYSYDYREEWLKISKALAKLESLDELKFFIIATLTNLVESSGGGLWLKDDQGHFYLASEQNLHLTQQELDHLKSGQQLPSYLTNKQWVIDFYELAHAPEVYDDIDLSPWCYEDSQVWLIVPLFHLNHLEAFAVLTQPKAPRKLNWEDHDLLKTVGMQLANAIALTKASDALANNRQFETYHRLSAYLVHDLKNLSAQIALIVKNADKHKHNPDFIDDTIDTLINVVTKMQHMVDQLKKGKTPNSALTRINLVDMIFQIQRKHRGSPSLQIQTDLLECIVLADQAKLTSVITNLIQNAQDASQKPDGSVTLVLSTQHNYAVIEVIDNGVGMEPSFIANRLFKPFDTTKGNAGMGIGAYEAKDYILKLSGSLDVKSKPGQGTTFTLQLPIIQPNIHEPN